MTKEKCDCRVYFVLCPGDLYHFILADPADPPDPPGSALGEDTTTQSG
jgi:hypothetical protein